jgi:hypothetical protein
MPLKLCTFRASTILSPMQYLDWILDLTLHHALNTSTWQGKYPRLHELVVCKSQWRGDNQSLNSVGDCWRMTRWYSVVKKLSKNDKYSTQLVGNTRLLCKNNKLVIPVAHQHKAVSWYHHYLQHNTSWRDPLRCNYWKGMHHTIRSHVITVEHGKLTSNRNISMVN